MKSWPMIIMTYLLCTFIMSYVDLWLYDSYIGDFVYEHVVISYAYALYWQTILRCSYDVVLAFILGKLCTNAYCLHANQMQGVGDWVALVARFLRYKKSRRTG